jgi:hypothetical protein
MANPNPSLATRFKPGASANPGGKPKPKPQPPDPIPDASPDPRGLHERAVAKLTSIMDDQGVEVGHQLMAIRLLIGDDLASTIRSMEHDERERAEAEQMTAADLAAVEGLLADWPEMTRETAEEFVADLHAAVTERLPKGSLTEQLRRHLLGLPEPRLTAAEKDAVIRQMYQKYGLDYELPKCGFKELPPPAPAPDPDREYLAAQAVERERQRREKLKHPAAVPSPPTPFRGPEVEAEPTEPPVMPAHLDSRIISFGDLAIFPGLGE